MRKLLAGGLGLSLGLLAANAQAQERMGNPASTRPIVTIGRPVALQSDVSLVKLDRPVPLSLDGETTTSAFPPANQIRRVSHATHMARHAPLVRGQSADSDSGAGLNLWNPSVTPTVGKHQQPPVDHAPPPGTFGAPPVGAPPGDPFFPSPPPGSPVFVPPPASGGPFGCGPCANSYLGSRWSIQSDHCFDQFISPVTNPFLFEDPRSLTEIRPIFMLQTIPNSQYLYQGGNIEFIGVQGRLAVTDRLSFVMNKLGGIFINPGSESTVSSESGFAEISLGPKYTFLRNECTNTLAAFGLTFQIPVGSTSVYQDTGTLSIVPYIPFAQNFGRSSYGSFNFMSTTGYAFAMDDQRTDQFFTSLHLDYGIANRFYPLVELNWFNYTQAGSARPLGFEGRDLINFGSTEVSGRNTVSLAAGMRYKFSEAAQIGLAAEFPVNGQRDIMDFRFTIDFIWRY